MKTEFVIADQHGRELFKHYCNNQKWCKVIKESKDEYAHWDISYTSGSTLIIGEIKVRNYNSDAFNDWDYEQKKHIELTAMLNKMKQAHPTKKIEIQYINIYKDEAIRIWTTTNIHNQQQPTTKILPATTLGQPMKVSKAIYKCNLDIESDRGLLNSLVFNVRQHNDKDDILPF